MSSKQKHTVIIESDEIIHDGPLCTRQNYSLYTINEHKIWNILYTRQRKNLEDIAYSKWLHAMDSIGLNPNQIPKLTETGEKLKKLTGWLPVPVKGFLSAKDYFWYIANREFPTVPTIRPMDKLEFIVEPDLFHDAFGHLPMHSDPGFANFIELFGKIAYEVVEQEERLTEMQRLYWFTVEYALIKEDSKLKVCGSGHLSGIEESRHSLSDKVQKKKFKLDDVVEQDFNPHILQPLLFVLDSYEQVSYALAKKAKQFGVQISR